MLPTLAIVYAEDTPTEHGNGRQPGEQMPGEHVGVPVFCIWRACACHCVFGALLGCVASLAFRTRIYYNEQLAVL